MSHPTVPHPAAQQERDRVNRLIEAAIAEHRCPPGYAAGGHNPVVNALRRLQEQVLAPKEQT